LPCAIQAQEVQAPQFIVIGNESVPETLLRKEMKQIFLGRMTSKDGNPIGFVIFTEKEVYAAFLKLSVGKTITQYTNYWKKQVFTGKGRMPMAFKNSAEVLEYVAETEGAISFLPPDDIVDTESVHLITVTE